MLDPVSLKVRVSLSGIGESSLHGTPCLSNDKNFCERAHARPGKSLGTVIYLSYGTGYFVQCLSYGTGYFVQAVRS